MGKSFQNYFPILAFEAEVGPQNTEVGRLYMCNTFTYSFSIFYRHTASLRI